MRSDSGAKPARILQGIARRHQPPDAIEIKPLHREQAGGAVRRVRRIERAAEQANLDPRGCGGRTMPREVLLMTSPRAGLPLSAQEQSS